MHAEQPVTSPADRAVFRSERQAAPWAGTDRLGETWKHMENTAALDVETATTDRDSVCQVGIAVTDDEGNITTRTWLVKPPANEYDPENVGIHGIDAEQTAAAPTFEQVWPEIRQAIGDRSLLSHRATFDQSCVEETLDRTGTDWEKPVWGCTWRMALTALPERSESYRLANLCGSYDIEIGKAHDAGDDAAATLRLAAALLHEHHSDDQISNSDGDRSALYENLVHESDDGWQERSSAANQRIYDATDPTIPAEPSHVEFVSTLLVERKLSMDIDGISKRDASRAIEDLRSGRIPEGAVPLLETESGNGKWGRRSKAKAAA